MNLINRWLKERKEAAVDFEEQRRQLQKQLGQMGNLPEDNRLSAFGRVGDQYSAMYGGQTFTGQNVGSLAQQIQGYDWGQNQNQGGGPGYAQRTKDFFGSGMQGGGGAGSWGPTVQNAQSGATTFPGMQGGGGAGSWGAQIEPQNQNQGGGGAGPPPGSMGAARQRNMEEMNRGGNQQEIQNIRSQIAQLQERLRQLQS